MTARVMRSGVAPMTGNLQMGSNKITGLADGTENTHAATTGQMDTAIAASAATLAAADSAIRSRGTVRVRDTTDSNPASSGYNNGQTIGGISVTTGDKILRDSASNQSRNGVWTVSASGAASRDSEYDTFNEHPGSIITVQEGTYADRSFLCTANKGGTLNSTAITFVDAVTAAPLTGLSLVSTTVVAATHTILEAIGFLQAQISALATSLFPAWTSYTPTVSSSSGTITSYSSSGGYLKLGRLVIGRAFVDITNNGTGSGFLNVAWPSTPKSSTNMVALGWHITSAYVFGGRIVSDLGAITCYKNDATYPVTTGSQICLIFVYEASS